MLLPGERSHPCCWIFDITLLRRACERQENFALERVESVANVTAFASPVALISLRN